MPTPPLDVPAEATRIRIRRPGPWGDLLYLSADDLAAYAPEAGQSVESVSGPRLLHTGTRMAVGERDVSVWSDGLLVGVSTHAPHALRMNREWDSSGRPRRLTVVEPLLVRLLSAENFRDLAPG
ncbi:hypothetical protein, partial [Streptomyces sp. NPDC058603]|uniref:hypothetical protein n=1 Tax=Streptomyces sp. NPDC058603 TaxID=3346551 RepID=UPI00365B79F3